MRVPGRIAVLPILSALLEPPASSARLGNVALDAAAGVRLALHGPEACGKRMTRRLALWEVGEE
jgi:ABC-type cobalamin transport system ATPase subunit